MKTSGKNNTILVESGRRFHWLWARKYKNVYIYSGQISGAEKLQADFMNMVDGCFADYRSGKIIDFVYDQCVTNDEARILDDIMQDERAHLIIKKTILQNLSQFFYSLVLLEKFIKNYDLEGKLIEFVPKAFPYSLYKIIIRDKDLLPLNVHIPQWYIKKMRLREMAINGLYRIAFILYPVALALSMKFKPFAKKSSKKYTYGIHVWDSWLNSAKPPYCVDFLEGKNAVNRENALYIVDHNTSKANLMKLKASGYDYCYFKEMVHKFSVWKFLRRLAAGYIKIAIQMLLMSCDKLWLTESYLKAFRWCILWDIFFFNYNVDLFVTVKQPGSISRVLCQKKRGKQSIYIYPPTVSGPLYRKDMDTLADSYCAFMIYDALLSSRMSIDYLKKNRNYFGRYVECGVLRSDIVSQVKHDNELKSKIKNKLGVPADKILISLFDTTIGSDGAILTSEEGYRMLRDVRHLLESNEDYFIIYKSRGSRRILDGSPAKREFDKIVKHKRVIYFENAPFNYSANHIIGASDLVVGAFTSSVPMESVVGGIKTICYVPSERFAKSEFIINTFPRFCARGYEELKEYTDHWLYSCTEEDFDNFQNDYIKKYVDSYCDGQATNRLRLHLAEYSKNRENIELLYDGKENWYGQTKYSH